MLAGLVGCSTTTIVGSWRDPAYTGSVHKILVIGVTDKDLVKRMFEDRFVSQLQGRGVQGVASYTVLPASKKLPREDVEAKARDLGVDKVLVVAITGRRREEAVSPGWVSGQGGVGSPYGYDPGRYGWYNDYSQRYDIVYQPPTVTSYEVMTVESKLFDMESGKLVWATQSEVTAFEDTTETYVNDFIAAALKNLAKERLIP
jgi:hypothetical protein